MQKICANQKSSVKGQSLFSFIFSYLERHLFSQEDQLNKYNSFLMARQAHPSQERFILLNQIELFIAGNRVWLWISGHNKEFSRCILKNILDKTQQVRFGKQGGIRTILKGEVVGNERVRLPSLAEAICSGHYCHRSLAWWKL